MKTDLTTSIAVAIVGILLSYFLCNLFIGPIEDVSFTNVNSSSLNLNIIEPSNEVFNYKALNPTVEVYIGDCTETDAYGECVDNNSQGS